MWRHKLLSTQTDVRQQSCNTSWRRSFVLVAISLYVSLRIQTRKDSDDFYIALRFKIETQERHPLWFQFQLIIQYVKSTTTCLALLYYTCSFLPSCKDISSTFRTNLYLPQIFFLTFKPTNQHKKPDLKARACLLTRSLKKLGGRRRQGH